ncbi:MAG: hypothetical protein S4CHLAM102_08470 [Chlamydiia bacterium]|nr:hypothetical protein [Chlamydiia bacterium]
MKKKNLAPITFSLVLCALACTSCNGSNNACSDRYDSEMTLHQIRSDLEEIKHDLNTQQMQVSILEGKILNHEDTLSNLKRDTIDAQVQKIDALRRQVLTFEKKSAFFESKLSESLNELKKLTSFAHDTNRTFSQYRDKIAEMEKNISIQNQAIEEMLKLKQNLKEFTGVRQQATKETHVTYQVQAGDSLGKIAARFHSTPEQLMQMNQLESDLIYAGQELKVPK